MRWKKRLRAWLCLIDSMLQVEPRILNGAVTRLVVTVWRYIDCSHGWWERLGRHRNALCDIGRIVRLFYRLLTDTIEGHLHIIKVDGGTLTGEADKHLRVLFLRVAFERTAAIRSRR